MSTPRPFFAAAAPPPALARLGIIFFAAALLLAVTPSESAAAKRWVEVKSAHVTVISEGSVSRARKMAWQIEQVRSAIAALWPWARVDLDRPFTVLVVDDERGMRALAPGYWERRGGVRPASVWVGGPDQHFLAIRSDLEADAQTTINPHAHAYFSYLSLVLHHSVDAELPLWFSRGLSAVLSNTIVRDAHVLVGPPIPWHLQTVREGPRLRLPALVAVTRSSREFTSDIGMQQFDAQSWAFMHFLLYGNKAARRPQLNQFFKLVAAGKAPDLALRETIGDVNDLEADFVDYIGRTIFTYEQVKTDVAVKREAFPERPLPPAEAASVRAMFHVAMGRHADARAAVDEARKADSAAPATHLAEARLLDAGDQRAEAAAAYARAVAAGSMSAHAHYRLASLKWQPEAPREALAEIETLLRKAVSLNDRYADAYSFLAQTVSVLGGEEAMNLAARAVQLEPSEPGHRLVAARILWRMNQHGRALKAVQAALTLSINEEQRGRARELQGLIEKDAKR